MNLNRTLLLAASLAPLLASAQVAQEISTVNRLGQTVTVVTPTRFVKTPPMSQWTEVTEPAEAGEKARERGEVDERRPLPEVTAPQFENEPDGALQTVPAHRVLKAPIINVNGQSGSGVPPDPTGAVGTDRYVQAVNTAYRVYLKTGQSTGSAHNLSFLWPGSQDAGDPIVMYDRHADRWFISQFNFGPNRMLIAVSETNNPAGSYYTYEFTFSNFPDYPKFSVWWDGYYMTSNSSKTAIVFEREQMLVGNPDARMIALSAPNVVNSGFTSVLPADADGDLPPAGTPCYFFNLEDNSWGAPSDRIKIYAMTTDWNTTSNSEVAQHQTLNTATFDPWLYTGWDNISQPNSSQRLDAGLGIFYFRAQHTRWSDHNSVVLCHGVDVGSNHCAIRWYELRDANDGNWSIYQQGTWNPDAADRYYASIAMDHEGNIGLGYSCADGSNDIYAGLRYTGRLASDPLGEMTFAEVTAISGTASQEGTNRFGDYAHISLDPDGATFWFTGEYIGTGGNPKTRIFSFAFAPVGMEDAPDASPAFGLVATQLGNTINVHVHGASSAATSSLEVIGMDGKRVFAKELETPNGNAAASIDASALAQGAWFIRVINGGQQSVERIVLTGTK
jgi:hypothetical protein